MSGALSRVREEWDREAAGYDESPDHGLRPVPRPELRLTSAHPGGQRGFLPAQEVWPARNISISLTRSRLLRLTCHSE